MYNPSAFPSWQSNLILCMIWCVSSMVAAVRKQARTQHTRDPATATGLDFSQTGRKYRFIFFLKKQTALGLYCKLVSRLTEGSLLSLFLWQHFSVALTVQEFALWIRLGSDSQICLPLPQSAVILSNIVIPKCRIPKVKFSPLETEPLVEARIPYFLSDLEKKCVS